MPTERVQIVVGSQTGGAQTGLAAVGDASSSMAQSVIGSVGAANLSFETFALGIIAAESAINLLRMATESLIEKLQTSIELALEYRGENDELTEGFEDLNNAVDRYKASFGEILLQGVEASGLVPELTDFFNDLADEIGDADSALGTLVRRGFQALIAGASFVLSGIDDVIRGLGALVEAAGIAQAGLSELFAEAEFALAGGARLAGLEEDIADLDAQIALVAQAREAEGRATAQAALDATIADLEGQRNALAEVADSMHMSLAAEAEAVTSAEQATARTRDRMAELRAEFTAGADSVEDFADRLREILDLTSEGIGRTSTVSRRRPGEGGGAESEEDSALSGLMEGITGVGTRGLSDAAEQFGADLFERLREGFKQPSKVGGEGGAIISAKDVFEGVEEGLARESANMLQGLARFAAGARDQFQSIADAMVSTIGGAADTIGNAFLQAAASNLITGGPIGQLLGIGFLFATVGGLLQGALAGGGRGPAPPPATASLAVVRPEAQGAQTNVFQVVAPFIFDTDATNDAMQDLAEQKARRGEVVAR